jgi:hypothetical protein
MPSQWRHDTRRRRVFLRSSRVDVTKTYRCRKCYQLKYESQYEQIFGSATNQRHKLRKRLGQVGSLEDPFPPKPKGMHWKTYRQLEALDRQLG